MDRETQKFWRQRRREMLRRNPPRYSMGQFSTGPVTAALLGLMILGTLVQTFVPGLLGAIATAPGGYWIILVISPLLPGGFINLIFSGLFVWLIGTGVESAATPWQYLAVFFGSGVAAGLALHGLGPGGGMAAFGLAGAYVYLMSHIDQRGAAQWGLLLLLINVVFSGFQPLIIAGEGIAFIVGLGLAYAMKMGH